VEGPAKADPRASREDDGRRGAAREDDGRRGAAREDDGEKKRARMTGLGWVASGEDGRGERCCARG